MGTECGRILDDDSLFRPSIFPVSFKGKRFAHEKLVKLYDQTDGSLIASLAWERYVPTIEYIHDYGCRLAFRTNVKKRAEGEFKEKSRHVYGGSYHLKADALRALANVNKVPVFQWILIQQLKLTRDEAEIFLGGDKAGDARRLMIQFLRKDN